MLAVTLYQVVTDDDGSSKEVKVVDYQFVSHVMIGTT